MTSTPTFETFRGNVVRFIERCAPSSGVFDEAAWEAKGAGRVFDNRYASCVVPKDKRNVRIKTMEER